MGQTTIFATGATALRMRSSQPMTMRLTTRPFLPVSGKSIGLTLTSRP